LTHYFGTKGAKLSRLWTRSILSSSKIFGRPAPGAAGR
jgi:hypothetical protein